jgi:glucokinase
MACAAIGIDLGGTSIKAGVVGTDLELYETVCIDTGARHGPDHVLDQLSELISTLSKRGTKTGLHILGIGIGVPGAIDMDRRVVSYPPNIPGWGKIDVQKELQLRLERPIRIVVENDANTAALGSAYHGAGQSFNSFIMVTLGTGVGGAIIHENRIFRGMTGAAGEIGHMTINYEGPFDRAGVAGAIESYLGQRFLSRHARYRLMNRRDSIIHKMAGDDLADITPRMLFDAAVEGDQGARDVLSWAGHKLGCVLGSAINLLDIRKVIVGGGLSAAGDYILSSARRTVLDFVTPAMHDGIEILQETRGNEVGMLGAAQLILQDSQTPGPTTSVNHIQT